MTPMEELREQAAKIADKVAQDVFDEHGITEPDTNWSGYPGKNGEWFEALEEQATDIAAAIRNIPLPAPVLPQAGEVECAREIYWQYMEETAAAKGSAVAPGEREKCLRGDLDHQHGVQIALRAIRSTPTETPTAAAPDDAILREAQAIVGIANSYQSSSEPSAIVPISVLRAAAMIVNRLALAPMLAKVAATDDGLRQAAQKAFAVLAAIEQTPANVWWVNTLDPETDVGEAYLALDAALSTATGDEAQQGEG